MGESMRWAEGFIAVDWGTTNRRAYWIDAGGRCTQEFEDDKGILAVGKGGFEPAVTEIRDRLGDHPLLLAGMVGSNRGWIEAPYVACPAGLERLADQLLWVEPGRTAIVPGVSYLSDDRADVMRGEEVQLLGAVSSGAIPGDCLVCHPGTHNKWAHIDDGEIVSFRTVMTGEMFSLLRDHSILSDLLQRPAERDDAFRAGVRRGLAHGGLTSDLFSVRAGVLLGRAEADDAASFTSGMLIGADIRIGMALAADSEIVIMGRPELTRLYALALAEAGRSGRELDGERAFLDGSRRIVELMR